MPLLSWVQGAPEVLPSRLCRWPESTRAPSQAVCTSRRLLYIPHPCSQLGVLDCVGQSLCPLESPFSHVHGHTAALGSHHSLLGSSSPSGSPQALKEAPCWPPGSANFSIISVPAAALCSDNSHSNSDGIHAHPKVTYTGTLYTHRRQWHREWGKAPSPAATITAAQWCSGELLAPCTQLPHSPLSWV